MWLLYGTEYPSFAMKLLTSFSMKVLQGKIPNPENQKNLKLCEYVEDFLLITTQFLFAALIHFKGVKLTL